MPGAGEWTGWSTCPGCCWDNVQPQPFSGVAQSAAAASTCSSGRPSKGGDPQHHQAGQGGGEGESGGSPGGFPRVRARGSGHRTAGRHVPGSIPQAGQGEEETALGDRCHADVGLCGPPEAAPGRENSRGSSTAHTWPAAQDGLLVYIFYCILFYFYCLVFPSLQSKN